MSVITFVVGISRLNAVAQLLATGHGTLGWTIAAGTGRVIADLISGKAPEISMEGRYDRARAARATGGAGLQSC